MCIRVMQNWMIGSQVWVLIELPACLRAVKQCPLVFDIAHTITLMMSNGVLGYLEVRGRAVQAMHRAKPSWSQPLLDR